MPEKVDKTKYNHERKSLKIQFVIYTDAESLLEKYIHTGTVQKNQQK